jgi:hypothetical protein
LLGLYEQAVQFAPVEQELPFPKRVVVPESSRQILRDMAVYQPSLANANLGICLPEGAFALAEGLDLGTYQYQPRFQAIQQVVIVRGGAILRNNPHALVLRLLGVCVHFTAIIAAARELPQVMDFDAFPAIGVRFYKVLTRRRPEIQLFIRLTQLCGFVAASHCGC